MELSPVASTTRGEEEGASQSSSPPCYSNDRTDKVEEMPFLEETIAEFAEMNDFHIVYGPSEGELLVNPPPWRVPPRLSRPTPSDVFAVSCRMRTAGIWKHPSQGLRNDSLGAQQQPATATRDAGPSDCGVSIVDLLGLDQDVGAHGSDEKSDRDDIRDNASNDWDVDVDRADAADSASAGEEWLEEHRAHMERVYEMWIAAHNRRMSVLDQGIEADIQDAMAAMLTRAPGSPCLTAEQSSGTAAEFGSPMGGSPRRNGDVANYKGGRQDSPPRPGRSSKAAAAEDRAGQLEPLSYGEVLSSVPSKAAAVLLAETDMWLEAAERSTAYVDDEQHHGGGGTLQKASGGRRMLSVL